MIRSLGKFWEFGGGRMVIAVICAHSVSISIGICQSYSAILLPQLKVSEKYRNLTEDETSWIASLGTITNPVGSILSGVLAEYFGRRRSIQISSLPFVLGWICLGLAQNINWLYAGRLITGVAAGMSTACYTYVGEISTPESRGFMQALGPICTSFGIVLTYTLGYYMDWAKVAYISIAFGIFSVIAIEFIPESPAYLLKQNRVTEGFDVLLWFRRNNALAQQEVDRFHENEKLNRSKTISFREMYFGPQNVKPFLILVGLFFLQEFSGIYTLLFYAVNFFKESSVDINEYVASIIVGAIRFSMSVILAYLINKSGRKILCTMSSIGMAVTMLIVAIYVKYYEVNSDQTKILSYLPLIGIMLNVAFSMIGMLPVPWVMVGEMFSIQVRPIMMGVVICIAQIFIFICVKIYNNMNTALHFSGTLMVFVAASIISAIYCKFVLIETHNKTLEDIEAYFRNERREMTGMDNRGFDDRSESSDKVIAEVKVES
ncbi:facilitated trehalose transporter Tret1 isoform X2 [Leptinotarsa decemlineata]|nr:facilitated trehalose transporter Tret1-like isoform X2 [Leptinotarsa decemlineata]XP_023013759.1 facilitated trehalose transporter Tret1-like isoform X2 [Leptinotarsa decemlineata]